MSRHAEYDKDRQIIASYRSSATRHKIAAAKLAGLISGSAKAIARKEIEILAGDLSEITRQLKP